MEEQNKIIDISIEDIVPNRFQPRLEFDESSLNELSNSIKQHGIIQPIVVRPLGDKYEIIAGERRYKASQLAGLSKVPVIIKQITDDKSAELAVVENLQRKNLTPIEEAISYKKLLDNKDVSLNTQEELAKSLGVSQPAVANKLRLLGLSDVVQDALLKNRISERHARSLLLLEDIEEQEEMLNKILSERLTVKQTDQAIKALLSKRKIEHLSEGEKPAEAEVIPDINEVKDINNINNLSEKINKKEEEKKLDMDSLLKVEGAEEANNIQPEEQNEENTTNSINQMPEKEHEEVEKEKINYQNISNNLNFNTQLNPFQEPEILTFDDIEIPKPIDKEEEKESLSELKSYEEANLSHDLTKVINETRKLVGKIEGAGFVVNTEEFDFEDMYQIILKINKD